MQIRNARIGDTEQILRLLSQVLEIHAAIRPDLFISGTTKYTQTQLHAIFSDPSRRTFVAVDDSGAVLGYAFCEIKEHRNANNVVPHTELYIDDFCVDSGARGRQIGRQMFRYVEDYARQNGFHALTLNVWTGNDGAEAFYDKMGMTPRSTKMELVL